MKPIEEKIFVITPTGSGSTLLINIIHGFFDPEAPVKITPPTNLKPDMIKEKLIDTDIKIYKQHARKGQNDWMFDINDAALITIERDKAVVPDFCHKRSNILVFNYNDVVYKSEYSKDATGTLLDSINHVAQKVSEKFGIKITNDQITNAKKRVDAMNETYEKIKNKPFKEKDNFYHIHGNHRNRKQNKIDTKT